MRRAAAGVAWLFAVGAGATELAAGENVVFVPMGSGPFAGSLETTLYLPEGKGPFPVVLVNHGKAAGSARQQERSRYPTVAPEFVRRGYAVVIPMRAGFARSGGQLRDFGCDTTAVGESQAESIRAAVDWVQQQPCCAASTTSPFQFRRTSSPWLCRWLQAAPRWAFRRRRRTSTRSRWTCCAT